MKIALESHSPGAAIPVQQHLRNRKLAKYFNRECAAALVTCSKLLQGRSIDPHTPFYYETGVMEFEDLGLDAIAKASVDEQGEFSQRLFIEHGTKAVPPLTQFKALYNMPLCLTAIELGLIGDNAVFYASWRGLWLQALSAPTEQEILLGCGKVHRDGSVESGFALATRAELEHLPLPAADGEAIEMFRAWAAIR